jgi:DNA-binding MarR family transcriptional regulator
LSRPLAGSYSGEKAMGHAVKKKSRPRANERLPLSELLQFRFVSIADSLLRAANKFYGKRFGINNAELRTLIILLDEQPLTIGELSRRGQIDKAWVSRSVANLLERGLVKRKAHPTDSRMLLISLTAAGVEMTKSIYPIARERHLQLMSGLPQRETLRIIDALEKNATELLDQSQEA